MSADVDLGSVFLINLDRRPDRLETATVQLNRHGIPFARWGAADGSKLPMPLDYTAGAGALGCRESHVAILRHALDNNIDFLTVFEDDVVLVDKFRPKLQAFMSAAPEHWRCLFLGGQHMKPPINIGAVLAPGSFHRTHAYTVRTSYIAELYYLFTSCTGHIDHCWGRNQGKGVYAPHDWLCAQGASKSDINGRTLTERWWNWRKHAIRKPPNHKVRR